MLLLGIIGGALYGLIPAFLKTRFGVNEILTSLMLVYVAQLILDYLVRGPWRDPKGFNFPQSVTFDPSATLHADLRGRARSLRRRVRAHRRSGHGRGPRADPVRLSPAAHRRRAARRALCRLQLQGDDAGGLRDLGRAGGACRHLRGVGADRPAPALDLARLRLHGHHRRVPRPAQSHRHPGRRPGGRADLHRRRERADHAEAAARSHPGLPGHPAALRARRRRARQLPHSFRRHGEGANDHFRGHPAHHRHRLDAAADRGPRRTRDRALRRAQPRRRGHDGDGRRLQLRRRRDLRLDACSASRPACWPAR